MKVRAYRPHFFYIYSTQKATVFPQTNFRDKFIKFLVK